MSVRISNSKEEKQFKVAQATLMVIESEGLLAITHSKVARRSGVSRAWIYEYVGKDTSALAEYAAQILASHFSRARLAHPTTREEFEAQLEEGVGFLFEMAAKDPVVIKLYYRYRGTENVMGKVISQYENQWLRDAAKSVEKILKLESDQAKLLAELMLVIRLGFAHRYASSANPKRVKESAEKIFSFIHALIPSPQE